MKTYGLAPAEPAPASSPDPYSRLAVSILQGAIHDFALERRVPEPPFETTGRYLCADRLMAVRRQIAAGQFLLERQDPVVILWFSLVGVHPSRVRRRRAWLKHLTRLRAYEAALILEYRFYQRRRLVVPGPDPDAIGAEDPIEVADVG